MSLFTNKTLMITGGTGSFGNAVLNRFLETDIGEIRIFSRDEKKQDDMRHEYQAKMPEVADKIKFYIGDVRNLQSCKDAMHGVDYIFHAAALKQVPSCEFFPMEAVKTNIIGTDNVLTAAIEEGVEAVICLSTDKAAYPINSMGKSKSLEESVAIAKSRYSGKTKICCTRYGNVMCSRGSVIPLWIDQIKAGNPITVTEPNMTRFIMSLEEAVDLVLYAFENGENGDLLIMKAPACSIGLQAEAVTEMFGGKKPFVDRLSELFVSHDIRGDKARKSLDITGLIGQYVHGNEPSHHIIYLFTLADAPRKTAELVREVFDRFYMNKPDGLCGNDDCGQMSAWYMFSAFGFYPVNPASGEYVLGAPQIKRAKLNLRGGKTFEIKADNLSKENKYVKSIRLNGKDISGRKTITYAEIMAGGILEFDMSNR